MLPVQISYVRLLDVRFLTLQQINNNSYKKKNNNKYNNDWNMNTKKINVGIRYDHYLVYIILYLLFFQKDNGLLNVNNVRWQNNKLLLRVMVKWYRLG